MNFTHPDVVISENVDLTNYTTFRLKSDGDVALVSSIDGLKNLLLFLKQIDRDYRLIGWGANQILPTRLEKLLIKLNFPFANDLLNQPKNEYQLPASVGLNLLTAHAQKFGLKGWEVLTGIPASLGGAIFMNAGTALGEIKDIIKSVQIMNKNGEIRNLNIIADSFSYRRNHFVKDGDIIIGATLFHHGIDISIPQKITEYLEYRKQTQPLTTKNCGCVFKNYSTEMPAGKVIDQLGLKGVSVGPLSISRKHSNFIENSGGATAQDFFELVKKIQATIKEKHGIQFELEVKID